MKPTSDKYSNHVDLSPLPGLKKLKSLFGGAFSRDRRCRDGDEDLVVLLTGAGGGLGRALARAHALRGHRLVLFDLDSSAVEQTAEITTSLGAEAIGLEGDVCSDADCEHAAEEATRRFGGVDILYNNAGIPLRALFRNSETSDVERLLSVNFIGAVRMTEACLPSLCERSGRIAAISSVAGFAPLTGRTAYAASKHAMHGFFGSLRSEVDVEGVSVSLVCPGYLNTSFRSQARDGASEMSVDDAARQIAGGVLARRDLVLVGRTAHLAWWMRRLWPSLFERLMRFSVRREFPSNADREDTQ